MAHNKLNRSRISGMTEFTQRLALLASIGAGLLLVGCGGESQTTPASSESSSDSPSTDTAMTDESMMMESEMNDESMRGSMDTSAEATGIGEEFADASLAHGEGEPSPETEISESERELMLASADPTTDPTLSATEPGSDEERARMLAEIEPTTDGTTESSDLRAEMAAAETSTGEPGSESAERAGFGTGEPDSAGVEGGDGRGSGQAQEPPADSPDYPAFKLVMGLMQGKHDGLKDHVATRGRGLIEKIRSGSLTTAEKDELRKTFAQPQLVGTPRTIRGSRTVTLNSAGQIISLVSKKQGADWKVYSITIKAAGKR